jgi:imidazolonepropionase
LRVTSRGLGDVYKRQTHGSICIGKKANVFITKEIPSYAFIPYSFGNNLVEHVILNGKIIEFN